MAFKLLVATFQMEDKPFIHRLIQGGVDVRILDCFDETHAYIHALYKTRSIQVAANHTAVKSTIVAEKFDVAVIREVGDDFVRTALLAQTLREARVGQVLVVSADESRFTLYRRCGAHQVIVAESSQSIWEQVETLLSVHVTAS